MVGNRSVPYSLVGQDTWFSPMRPGFESRWGNTLFFCVPALSRRLLACLSCTGAQSCYTVLVPDSLGG